MAIIRNRQPRKRREEQIIVDDKWMKEFYSLCGDSAWNLANNWWLNEQYKNGATPKEAREQCTVTWL